ncbi:MAG: zinc ABC transporter substrate-binding protein [Actinobacteria bacterium]|nr:zinc ABC transporter substrate-binding protein [Actinomycetota bacterium]
MKTWRASWTILLTGVVTLTAGCGSTRPGTPSASASGRRLRIVASTNVYGNIATAIAGDQAEVTSIIDDPTADPHDYSATVRDRLAVAGAAIVIENGGGYDDFMTTLRQASHKPGATLIDVVALSGHRPSATGELNEHVWYDLATVRRLADVLVETLSQADPMSAHSFAANGKRFVAGLDTLSAQVAQVRAAHAGVGVAITEPVPLYLLDAMGLVNRTPPAFSRAVEAGTGASVGVLHQTNELFAKHRVKVLVYNAQTSGPETEAVIAAARRAGIPVVGVTETLPANLTYLAWMHRNIDAIAEALR